jgi:hypothetical protein
VNLSAFYSNNYKNKSTDGKIIVSIPVKNLVMRKKYLWAEEKELVGSVLKLSPAKK